MIREGIDENGKKKIHPVNEGWLIVIWQDGEERTFLARRTQQGSHGFDIRRTNKKERKEYSMHLGAEMKK